jgi:glyoxylase-like metal-dependent hydrolase (beta-lactamase superfamily II)
MDVQELRPGLWRWTARHPEWDDSVVSSAYLEAPGAVVLVDPLVPRGEEERFFEALDSDVERVGSPVAIVLTNPWHRRSAGELAQRYDARIFVAGQDPLPGGLQAYPGGMQPEDFVVHAPSQRALFTGDTLLDGRLCPEDWLAEGRAHHVACLTRLLELDADLVVPSHGEPLAVEQLSAQLHSPPSAE